MAVNESKLQTLLFRLEQIWKAQRAPIAANLAPGLTSAAIDELTAALDLTVPIELKIWWGWHNGTTAPWASRAREVGVGGWGFPSVQEALDLCQELRQTVLAPEDGIYWLDSWLPVIFIDTKNLLYVDTATAPVGEPVPVRFRPWSWEEYLVDRTDSFTAVIEVWIQLLDAGAFYWDAEADAWQNRYTVTPPELWRTGLI